MVSSKLKPHHHINVNSETRNDMHMWEHFLEHPDIFCHPYMDFAPVEAAEINFHSDAPKCETKGFRALFNKSWMFGSWGKDFITQQDPSIKYLELFAVTSAVLT